MLHVNSSIGIHAPAQQVMDTYLRIDNWPKLFPATIKGVRVLQKTGSKIEVEVDHRYEGKVFNIVTISADDEIRLEEFKPKYRAVFVNRFIPTPPGTDYQVEAFIELSGLYRLAQPFISGLVKRRILKFVLLPMKQFIEGTG